MMKYLMIAGIVLILATTGCYLPLGGKVIDAETKQPIEGAVVIVQWTVQHGIGFTYHTVDKIAETATDEKGKFSLPGAYNPFVDEPQLVIYKPGYVAWNNNTVLIFKNNASGIIETVAENRTDYDGWKHGYLYQLEQFKEGYSHYINSQTMGYFRGASIYKTPKYEEALTYERRAAEPELEILRRNFYGK